MQLDLQLLLQVQYLLLQQLHLMLAGGISADGYLQEADQRRWCGSGMQAGVTQCVIHQAQSFALGLTKPTALLSPS